MSGFHLLMVLHPFISQGRDRWDAGILCGTAPEIEGCITFIEGKVLLGVKLITLPCPASQTCKLWGIVQSA